MSSGTTSHRREAGETVNEEADGRILEQRKEHDADPVGSDPRVAAFGQCRHGDGRDAERRAAGPLFSPEGDPLTKRLNIDSQTAVDVPLISIVNPSTVNIKEVEMEFSVQINSSDLRCKQPQKGFQAGDQQTAKYQVHVSARQQQPTEGLSKLMDIMASCVEPVKLGE